MEPIRPTRPVFLTGFMGAGKTTVGKLLAARLGVVFFDLDETVVKRAGRSIADIFANDGEAAFRALETHVLGELLAAPSARNAVIALGGGTLMDDANLAVVCTAGQVFFLDAPEAELRTRCEAAGAVRPLFQDPYTFRHLYRERRPRYMEAGVRVETAGKTACELAEEISRMLAAQAEGEPD